MTIEYGVEIPKKAPSKISPESKAVLAFAKSDEKVMALHFDDYETAFRNAKKIGKLVGNYGYGYRVMRRANSVFIIKEDILNG